MQKILQLNKYSLSGLLFGLVILYPLIYAIPLIRDIGTKFENYFFFGILILLISRIILTKFLNENIKISLSILALFFAIVFITFINIDSIRYSKPTYFFVFLFLVFSVTEINTFNFNALYPFFKLIIISFFVLSFLYIKSKDAYFFNHTRYQSFFNSPTIFSVMITVMYILSLFSFKKKWIKILLFIISVYFLYLTKTRLNLVFFALIVPIYYVLNYDLISKQKLFIIFNTILLSIYPIYNYVMNLDFFQNLIMIRYGEKRDASFGLRSHLNDIGLNFFLESSRLNKIFGNGSEYTRIQVIEIFGQDLLVHNDYIRILVDFGIIFTLLYLILLYKLSSRNNISFILCLLYLFSFYHNMIYSMFLVPLIIICSKLKHNNELEKKLS
ncbi:O-antigen ligase family protein [Flammeovirga sp. MY04]|uniref:O-antigen ligase family protein n=1 Tax=Flammeovirga sp. MY04 TaxID=1191459 RepID=UPI0008061F46|nr:O-antigen ligase family protein [Flammeovirga sp. MY04]